MSPVPCKYMGKDKGKDNKGKSEDDKGNANGKDGTGKGKGVKAEQRPLIAQQNAHSAPQQSGLAPVDDEKDDALSEDEPLLHTIPGTQQHGLVPNSSDIVPEDKALTALTKVAIEAFQDYSKWSCRVIPNGKELVDGDTEKDANSVDADGSFVSTMTFSESCSPSINPVAQPA